MFNFLLYHHSGSYNHGCEAIVRTITNILSQNNPAGFYIASTTPSQDEEYFAKGAKFRFGKAYQFLNFSTKTTNFINNACARAFKIAPFLNAQMRPTLREAKRADAVISVGGDVYSYGKSTFSSIVDTKLRKRCKISVLLGCSINSENLEPLQNQYKINNFKKFDLIIARESITYNALLKAGIDKNTKLYPDPAFTLDTVCLPPPPSFAEGNTVGINVSPLIMKYEQKQNMAWENYRQLIRYILQSSDMKIALIPHVVQQGNDDRIPLQAFYDEFQESGRVVMIEDHNCMELKGYISRCRMFVCARTHASIAAYSTCVPTLVAGYSVKAKGIAKDIFGTYDNYVVPVQSLQKEDDLVKAFQWLTAHEDEIRRHLREFMPSYCAKAWDVGKEIQKLIGEGN